MYVRMKVAECMLVSGVVQLLAVLGNVSADGLPREAKADNIADVGGTTGFTCIADRYKPLIWSYTSPGSDEQIDIYDGLKLHARVDRSRYSVTFDNATRTGHLRITDVNSADSGQYDCYEVHKSDLTRSFQLTVLDADPSCAETPHRGHSVGRTHAVVCNVTYSGNLVPAIECTSNTKNSTSTSTRSDSVARHADTVLTTSSYTKTHTTTMNMTGEPVTCTVSFNTSKYEYVWRSEETQTTIGDAYSTSDNDVKPVVERNITNSYVDAAYTTSGNDVKPMITTNITNSYAALSTIQHRSDDDIKPIIAENSARQDEKSSSADSDKMAVIIGVLVMFAVCLIIIIVVMVKRHTTAPVIVVQNYLKENNSPEDAQCVQATGAGARSVIAFNNGTYRCSTMRSVSVSTQLSNTSVDHYSDISRKSTDDQTLQDPYESLGQLSQQPAVDLGCDADQSAQNDYLIPMA